MTLSNVRILMSGHCGPPMGGIATFYESLLQSSLPRRVQLRFVESSSQKRPLSKSGSWSFLNLMAAAKDCGRFARTVICHRPAVAHIATAFGLSFVKHSVFVVIGRLFGRRVLLHPHCSLASLYLRQPRLWRWYFRQVVRLTNGIIVLSSEWDQLSTIVPGSRIYHLPNGIDQGAYREIGRQRASFDGSKPTLRVLYLGYLGEAKGSFDLVHAAHRLADQNNVVFDLIGDELTPGELMRLKRLVSDLRLDERVRIRSAVEKQDKLEQLRLADVFVYPSYHEGMPMAVIEAMASALPIVATRVGGLPDLVTDSVNGFLVEAGNPAELAGAIHRLAVDPDLRSGMSTRSYQIAKESFDIEQVVTRLLEIYGAALGHGLT